MEVGLPRESVAVQSRFNPLSLVSNSASSRLLPQPTDNTISTFLSAKQANVFTSTCTFFNQMQTGAECLYVLVGSLLTSLWGVPVHLSGPESRRARRHNRRCL